MERSEISLLLAKVESAYATDSVPTAASNAIPVTNLRWQPQVTRISRRPARHGFGKIAGFNSPMHAVLTFDYAAIGNGAIQNGSAGSAVEIDILLRACDLAAAYTAESTGGAGDGLVTYAPTRATDEGTSLSFYFHTEGKRHIVKGAKGTFTVRAQAGGMVMFSFTFTGQLGTVSDQTFPSATVNFPAFYDTIKPPLFEGAAFAIDTLTTPVITDFTFDLGNEVVVVPNGVGSTVQAIRRAAIVDRNTTARCNPEAITLATYDFWTAFVADSVLDFEAGFGSTAGNRIGLAFSAQAAGWSYEDVNKLRHTGFDWEVVGTIDPPNADFALTFSCPRHDCRRSP